MRPTGTRGWRPPRTSTPGPPAFGSTYRLQVRFLGLTVPLEYLIEEIDAPTRVVAAGGERLVRSTDVIEVAPATDGGSTVTYEATLTPKGLAAAFGPTHGRGLPAHRRPGRRRAARRPGGMSAVRIGGVAGRSPTGGRHGRGHGGPELQPGRHRAAHAGSRHGTTPPTMDGRVAVVTGATSGIGLAAATALARWVPPCTWWAATPSGRARRAGGRGGRTGCGPRRPGGHGRPRCRGSPSRHDCRSATSASTPSSTTPEP